MFVVDICDIADFGRTPFNSKSKDRREGEGDREQNDSGEGEERRRASSRHFHKIVLKALRAVEKREPSLGSASNVAQASKEGESAQEPDKAEHRIRGKAF